MVVEATTGHEAPPEVGSSGFPIDICGVVTRSDRPEIIRNTLTRSDRPLFGYTSSPHAVGRPPPAEEATPNYRSIGEAFDMNIHHRSKPQHCRRRRSHGRETRQGIRWPLSNTVAPPRASDQQPRRPPPSPAATLPPLDHRHLSPWRVWR
jgi:hypothetical protein